MFLAVRALSVTLVAVWLGAVPAEAARLKISGLADARAVIVNDGSGDVGTTNGASSGETTVWSLLGYNDPSELLVVGSFPAGTEDWEGTLTTLQIVATVPGCTDCDALGVEFNNLNGPTAQDAEVLAFISGNLLFLGPTGPTSVLPVMDPDQLYYFVLSSTDAAALASVIANYGAGNVHIGLAGFINWSPNSATEDPPDATFQTVVPEPATLTLLGSGLVAAAAMQIRRRRPRR